MEEVLPKMPATFSFLILFTLLLMLAVSSRVFYVLNRQWTSHRPIAALQDWVRDRKYKLAINPTTAMPAALEGLKSLEPQIECLLTRGLVTLLRITTHSPERRWNLLIHETQNPHEPAALRPVGAKVSYLDLFTLNSFPTILPPDRFLILATDIRQARKIAATSARGLLPADIGLLVHGPYITLDFSSRPFDTIEFERLLAIMDQVRQAI